MVRAVHSFGISGVNGFDVSVECALSAGMPAFDVVGLPDAAVKESRERVKAAVKSCGLKFPASHVTVNLAPADKKKAGTLYDLPILLSVLSAAELIPPMPESMAFIGELSLNGELRPVPGVLSMAMRAARGSVKELFVPSGNAEEASFAGGLTVYPVENVSALVEHLTGRERIAPAGPFPPPRRPSYNVDFSEVKGQSNVKRALEVAAAGGHNILLIGPPGSGKSMLAKRLPTILPDMSRREQLETTALYSVAGQTVRDVHIMTERPFRSPHHTMTHAAMAGGSQLQPGEISLAHNGVLFLDELPEFHRDVIEALRQPMEDGRVTISRAVGSTTYPCRFMFVGAMNPCKCGWYGDPSGRCNCSESSVAAYREKISGPLLDRIDLHINVRALPYDQLHSKEVSESSADIKARVDAARAIQRRRFRDKPFYCNAQMDQDSLRRFCRLDDEAEQMMRAAFDRLALSARSHDRILRVSRTIADLAGDENLNVGHLSEAIGYREYKLDIDRGQ